MSSVDKLTIETPEQTLLEFPLAGIGSRFLAIALDTLLQFAAYIVLGLIAALLSTEGFLPTLGKQWGVAIVIFLAFVVQFGYYTTFEALWNGQTPGSFRARPRARPFGRLEYARIARSAPIPRQHLHCRPSGHDRLGDRKIQRLQAVQRPSHTFVEGN